MRFQVFAIIPADTFNIVDIVEKLMAPYDYEQPASPYRVDIATEEVSVIAQEQGLSYDHPLLLDKLQERNGYPCYQDEQGYYYISHENPNGHWDGWILHDIQADVYQLPNTAQIDVDPLAVVTPDGVWHEMPYRWDETAQQAAHRRHLVQQLLTQYPDYKMVSLDCHS